MSEQGKASNAGERMGEEAREKPWIRLRATQVYCGPIYWNYLYGTFRPQLTCPIFWSMSLPNPLATGLEPKG